jgi:hypothetical protein
MPILLSLIEEMHMTKRTFKKDETQPALRETIRKALKKLPANDNLSRARNMLARRKSYRVCLSREEAAALLR